MLKLTSDPVNVFGVIFGFSHVAAENNRIQNLLLSLISRQTKAPGDEK